jgi:hypothetical protein
MTLKNNIEGAKSILKKKHDLAITLFGEISEQYAMHLEDLVTYEIQLNLPTALPNTRKLLKLLIELNQNDENTD